MPSRPSHRCLRILRIAQLFLLALSARCQLHALDAAQMQAMVIVEGDTSRGSAFVLKMSGKTFLVTNSHVVRGNRNVKFKNLRNVEIATGALEIADAVDAVRAEVVRPASALELQPNVESIKIGDDIIVAGNSEGEGVVREIPGKVVGIGPDRIEVDAEFVPGNSGSPILLKSTGKVIGVATYMKIARGAGAGRKSPMSLNEVRRFGYRLDTVARWIKPLSKDRLLPEGVKLSEMEELMSSISALLDANAAIVTKWGVSAFVNKDRAQQFPAFAALSMAVDAFVKSHALAKDDDERKKNAAAFFAKLKGIVADDVRGLNENQFSGFYAVQLKEDLARCRQFSDWHDGTVMPGYRETWLASQTEFRFVSKGRANAPPVDPAKLKLALTDHVLANEPPESCHQVSYPSETEPADLEKLFWIIEDPSGARNAFRVHKTALRVRTPASGTYRVFVEYRGADTPHVVSNVVEVKAGGVQAADPAIVINAADKAKPLAEFLAGTRWLWYGKKDRVIEFRKDGKFGSDDWTKQGFLAAWEATSPSQVKLTVVRGRFQNRVAILDFSEDRSYFTGHDLDPARVIDKSPRATGDELRSPAPAVLE